MEQYVKMEWKNNVLCNTARFDKVHDICREVWERAYKNWFPMNPADRESLEAYGCILENMRSKYENDIFALKLIDLFMEELLEDGVAYGKA